ncbi:hypothetical protein MANES_13G106550v8 [Manihot esculenta]|uniref:Uncharacterized protein n=1 Tax=Manihot esculenta TaxID=3983 RepID=A0ACB7GQZ5_MANES|nr:hypothetical protein MANES_13G106550v8 [Manihot esculenta]
MKFDSFVQSTIPHFDGHYDHWSMLMENFLRSKEMFDYVVCAIEESKDIDTLSLDELQSPLLVHEQKMNRSSTIEEKALKASTFDHSSSSRGRGRGDRGNRNGNTNSKTDDDQSYKGKGRFQHFDKSKIECYKCHKFSHFHSECRTKISNDKENREKSNFMENHEAETFDINIKTKNGFIDTISSVFYVPGLKSNLLSAGQLQEKGYVITIQKGACEIYDPSRGAIAIMQMSSNRLFPLQIQVAQTCFMAKIKNLSWLCHFRYGHLNFNGLRTLQ